MTLQPILELKNVSAAYGRIKAIKGISLKVYPGEVVSIIGANGAGKSTTLMAISSVLPITGGEICYDGVRIDGLAADLLPSRGLCQVPEGRRIFPRLTVEENLDMGAFFRKDRAGILHASIGKKSFGPEKLLQNLSELLDTVNRLKPSTAKGTYLKAMAVATTMGPGVKIDTQTLRKFLEV